MIIKSIEALCILKTQLTIWRNKITAGTCFELRIKVWKLIEENTMLNWALIFLVIAIIAGVLGLSGIAGTASSIAWILFVVGVIMAIVFFITGRRPKL